MSVAITTPDTVLAFKAGRAFRTEGTNSVVPDPAKGAILIERGEDELLHFMWKNRTTGETEEDLILFPTDATFVRVAQAEGRVYVLKFSSSNQRHFFWLQNAIELRDEEFVHHINRLLEMPGYIPVWSVSSARQEAEAAAALQASTSQAAAPSAAAGQPTADQLTQLRDLVSQMAGGAETQEPELSLTDILTPAVLTPLFTAQPALLAAVYPQLPSDLPVPPSPQALADIVGSPPFRAALLNFDRALRTGMLAGLVRQLGLPEEAGTGVEAFLRAIQEQAAGERMDTD